MIKQAENRLKKQLTFFVIAFYVIFCALMVVGTFYDLQIDKAIFNYRDKFAYFMEQWGMLASYFAEIGAFATICACYHKFDEFKAIAVRTFPFLKSFTENKAGNVIIWIGHKGAYIGFLFGLYNGAMVTIKYCCRRIYGHGLSTILQDKGMASTPAEIITILSSVLLAAVSLLVFIAIRRKVSDETRRVMESMSVITLLMMVCCMSIDVLKDIFTRVRFREMIAFSHGLIGEDGFTDRGTSDIPKEWIKDTDFSAFDFWFRKGNDRGVYSEATSFPSGHTSGASYSLLLIPFFYKKKNLNKQFVPASIIGIGYISVMAVTRLVRGAHYLTDVSSAALIMFTSCLICWLIVSKFEAMYDKNA